jgi:hypothetical protein
MDTTKITRKTASAEIIQNKFCVSKTTSRSLLTRILSKILKLNEFLFKIPTKEFMFHTIPKKQIDTSKRENWSKTEEVITLKTVKAIYLRVNNSQQKLAMPAF